MNPSHSGSEVFQYRGLKMVGILNRPAGPDSRKFPAVLFLHGFPGAEKNVDMQRRLLKMGVASFSLHFCGAWGSEGAYSFTDLVAQAKAGLRFLSARPFVDRRRLALFGFSMGGWVAINLGARGGGLKAVAAACPVGGPEMLGPRTRQFIAHARRPLRVKSIPSLVRDFSRAVRGHDPAAAAAALRCPLLLVHGDRDTTVPFAVSERIAAVCPQARLVAAHGARHDFLDRREWLTRLVCAWLGKRLRASGRNLI